MLKVVIFDSGYGGEFFADRLSEELPILEIIRVIDWRNAEKFLDNPRQAKKFAEAALRPYINRVDLIVFANHLLSLTGIKYFSRKYKNQKFLGLELVSPDSFVKRDVLILTTKAVTKTIGYRNFILHLKRKNYTLTLDSWPAKIDDGELTENEIRDTIKTSLLNKNLKIEEIVLACSQFDDIKKELKNLFGRNLKIYDSFDIAHRKICQILKIRGRTGKKSN